MTVVITVFSWIILMAFMTTSGETREKKRKFVVSKMEVICVCLDTRRLWFLFALLCAVMLRLALQIFKMIIIEQMSMTADGKNAYIIMSTLFRFCWSEKILQLVWRFKYLNGFYNRRNKAYTVLVNKRLIVVLIEHYNTDFFYGTLFLHWIFK